MHHHSRAIMHRDHCIEDELPDSMAEILVRSVRGGVGVKDVTV